MIFHRYKFTALPSKTSSVGHVSALILWSLNACITNTNIFYLFRVLASYDRGFLSQRVHKLLSKAVLQSYMEQISTTIILEIFLQIFKYVLFPENYQRLIHTSRFDICFKIGCIPVLLYMVCCTRLWTTISENICLSLCLAD